MSVIVPLDELEVVNTRAFPEIALDVVILPLAVKESVPLVEVILPLVAILAEPPVVTTVKLLPTDDAASVTAPELVM